MLVEGCKHEIEITVPVDEIARETDRVVANIQQKAKLPGFRPGKAPASLIRTKFSKQVRDDVLENLLPKYFRQKVEEEHLEVVGRPNVKDVHFHEGEPLRFKAEFEVAPEIELKDYRGVTVHYSEPQVCDEDIAKRLEEIREQKAQFVNVEPRAAGGWRLCGGYARQPIGRGPADPSGRGVLHVGDPDTMPGFSEALRGMSPEEEKEFEVTYPEDFGQERLAGKTVRFPRQAYHHPDQGTAGAERRIRAGSGRLSDAERSARGRAQSDLSRARIRRAAEGERRADRQADRDARISGARSLHRAADRIAARKPISGAGRARHRSSQAENRLGKLKEAQRPKALHDVKASLLVDKVAEREAIAPTNDEVDAEVQRIAKQQREPVAAVRKKLEKDGVLSRIAYQIRSKKTLNFLFEHARKEAGEPEPAEEKAAE